MSAGRDLRIVQFPLSDIHIVGDRRALNEERVGELADSIKRLGLRHPITIRHKRDLVDPEDGELYGAMVLVAGRHRLAAHERLGLDKIECVLIEADDDEAKLWEIAENLHRSDLTVQERSDQIAEWVQLVERQNKLSQVATVSKGGRGNEGGIRAAGRELGIDKDAAHRAIKIASISPEAKDAAREAGLENNQSALLKVSAAEPARQVDVVREIAAARSLKTEQDIKNRAAQDVAELFATHIPADAWDMLKASIKTADNVNLILAAFNNLVGNSIMDRRHG